jgi:hypothetical protein
MKPSIRFRSGSSATIRPTRRAFADPELNKPLDSFGYSATDGYGLGLTLPCGRRTSTPSSRDRELDELCRPMQHIGIRLQVDKNSS